MRHNRLICAHTRHTCTGRERISNRQGYGWFVHQRTFRSSRCVIPGLTAGVAGRAADQVGDRRRPVFGPRAGTPGPGRRRDG